MDHVETAIVGLLRDIYPESMALAAIAAELNIDQHQADRACAKLNVDRKLVRTSSRPNCYRLRAAALAEVS